MVDALIHGPPNTGITVCQEALRSCTVQLGQLGTTDSAGNVFITGLFHSILFPIWYRFYPTSSGPDGPHVTLYWGLFDLSQKEGTIGGEPGMFVFNADDGKGNVSQSISVVSDQKFWFKGFTPNPGDRVDVWFDRYGPDPPYPYIDSVWLATVFSNPDKYFDTSPLDVYSLHDTGNVDGQGRKLWSLQGPRGDIWTGPIGVNLGFKGTLNGDPNQASPYATVTPVAGAIGPNGQIVSLAAPPRAREGDQIIVSVEADNVGDAPGTFGISLHDRDIQLIIDHTIADIPPGNRWAGDLFGTMPNRNWNLRVEIATI